MAGFEPRCSGSVGERACSEHNMLYVLLSSSEMLLGGVNFYKACAGASAYRNILCAVNLGTH